MRLGDGSYLTKDTVLDFIKNDSPLPSYAKWPAVAATTVNV